MGCFGVTGTEISGLVLCGEDSSRLIYTDGQGLGASKNKARAVQLMGLQSGICAVMPFRRQSLWLAWRSSCCLAMGLLSSRLL